MSLTIKPNKEQVLSLQNQLILASLPANKRIAILKKLGRYEMKLARDRIKKQTTVDGDGFEKRERGSKKMLIRIGKSLEPYVIDSNRLELKHRNVLTGQIAALHQAGGKEPMGAAKMKKIHGKPDYSAQISRGQAKALIKLGARARKTKGSGYRKATIRELMASMTVGQAELALETLRNKKSKQSWDIPIKARPFLGDSTDNVQRQLVSIIEQINQKQRG
ncbi:hypothetical protein V8687_18260 [Shewanella baltica]|uniref:hypothetical protein n=1 Tax=Shewanella baltica TaxID=62322 RepID=UPI0030D46F97